MVRWLHLIVLLAVVALVAQACALAATPTLQWTDSSGSHQINLVLIVNPDYDCTDPYTTSPQMVWAPSGSWCHGFEDGYITPLSISATTVSPMTLAFSGSLIGTDLQGGYQVWNELKVFESITDGTNVQWTDYHYTSAGSQFLDVWQSFGEWDTFQGMKTCDFYADGTAPVHVGEAFVAGIDLSADTDTNGNASGTMEGHPSFVPEPGVITALLSGIVGLTAFSRRRKA